MAGPWGAAQGRGRSAHRGRTASPPRATPAGPPCSHRAFVPGKPLGGWPPPRASRPPALRPPPQPSSPRVRLGTRASGPASFAPSPPTQGEAWAVCTPGWKRPTRGAALAVHTTKRPPPPPAVSPGGPRATSKASTFTPWWDWVTCSSEKPGRGSVQPAGVCVPLAQPQPTEVKTLYDPHPHPHLLFTGDATAPGIILRPKPQLQPSHTHTCPCL